MDSTANILQFCRLCLVKDGVNIPIFDEQGDIRQIYLKISSCLPVKVAREDHLPKKICDGCSNKLDNFYDFWRTSAESEKQLLAWLGATGKDAAQVNVKEEDNFDEPLASDISKNDDDENKCYMFEQKVEEGPPVEINDEPPPSKRPRRTAAVKAAIAMDQNSDDDGDSGEPITKMEDDSDETDGDDREPAFVDVPSTSADDQPGPSGVSKDGSDAPCSNPSQNDGIDICSQNKEEQGDTKDTQETVASKCEEEVDEILEILALSEPSNITISQVQSNVQHVETKQDQEVVTKTLKMKTKQGKRYTCPVCGNAYKSEHGMIEHSKFEHPMIKLGDKPPVALLSVLKPLTAERYKSVKYQCLYCTNSFYALNTAYSHLRRKHSGEAFELTDGASVALGKFCSSSAMIPTGSKGSSSYNTSGTNIERLESVGAKPKDSSFGITPGSSNQGLSNVVSKGYEKSRFGGPGQSQQLLHYKVSKDKEVPRPTIPDVVGERRGLKRPSSQEHFRNETGFRSERNRGESQNMYHYKVTDPERSSNASSQGYFTSGEVVRLDRNEKFRDEEVSTRQTERYRSDRNPRRNQPYGSYTSTNAGARRESTLSSYDSTYEDYSSNVASGSYRGREVEEGVGYDPHSARRGIYQSSGKKQFQTSRFQKR